MVGIGIGIDIDIEGIGIDIEGIRIRIPRDWRSVENYQIQIHVTYLVLPYSTIVSIG